MNESIMKSSKKSTTSSKIPLSQQDEDSIQVNAKVNRQCGYCGLRSGHRYEGDCKLMSQRGYLLNKTDIDKFCIKLTFCHHHNRLGSFIIPDGCTKLTCVHGYVRIEHDGVLSQSLDNDSNFLCVSFVFINAVIRDEYSKCFVCALVVSDWMSISKNQKKVMIGNK